MRVEKINDGNHLAEHYLYPGKVFCDKKPHIVQTILGSCVAVYLWDPVLQFGGVNHYMLPEKEGSSSHKYGSVAIPDLFKRMLQLGSAKTNLKAKVFGGGELANSTGIYSIGSRNIILAQETLKNEKIPIVSFSMGGHYGRKVIVYTATGEVYISRIKQSVEIVDKNIINPPRK